MRRKRTHLEGPFFLFWGFEGKKDKVLLLRIKGFVLSAMLVCGWFWVLRGTDKSKRKGRCKLFKR